MANSLSSKVIFGVGVALAVAAISSIFISMVATQAQQPQGGASSSASSGATNTAGSQGTQSQSGGQQTSGGGSQQQGQQGGGSGQGGASTQITISQGAASQQTQQFYQPDPAQVSAGSQVTWQNKDSAPHTATADDGSFDTGNIQPGQSGSAQVQGQGQVSYHCTIHPFMKGTLQVSTGSSPSSSQQGSAGQQQNNSQQQGNNAGASQQGNGSSEQQTNSQQPSASGGAGQSQQSSQRNQQPAQQQKGTQTSSAQQSSSGQSSGNVVQSLQQAGQALIQAGNALQQASGGSSNGTSTASQQQPPGQQSGSTSSSQSQGNNNPQQSPQGTSPQSQTNQQPQSTSQQQSLSQQPSAQQQGSSAQSGQSQQNGTGSASPQQAGGSQQPPAASQQPSQGGQQQGGQAKQTQTAGQQQSSGGGQQSQQSGGMTNQIDIPQGAQSGQNGYYSPANAQVTPGSQVTWNNKDSVAHTATAQDGSFDTRNIPPGSSGSATIQGQGQIQYYCTIHPWMTGTLTVGSSGGQGGAQQAGQQGGGAAPAAGGQQQPQQQQGGAAGQQPSQSGGAQQQQGGGGSSAQTSGEGFPIRTQATAFKVLPKSTSTDTGLEAKHKDDWINPNHDIHYTRSSQQTTIGKDNVDKLQVKWILNSDFPIENPPLIVGDRGYAQDNAMRVIAFDVNTGLNLWKFDPGVADKQSQQLPRGVFSHGITYDGEVVFAPTGANGTVVALNATDGKLIWQSASVGDPRLGYREPMPPIVWKDYVIAGSALGDEPPFAPAAKGSITAFNRTNGEKIWNISTVTGAWVQGENAKKNGGATIWSGGSFDPQMGIIYLPTGNAAPDFNASSRPPPNPYTSSVIAIDIKNGHILWDTPSVSATDQHDWDTAWGTSLAKVKTDDGNVMKVVIAQNKRGEGFALNADDGKVLWNDTLGVEFRTGAQPTPFGSGEVWPGANYGVEDYNANDNKTAYFAVSNMGFNYFKDAQGGSGHLKPVFDAIDNGIGNGTIVAVDIKTGKVKWEHPTEFPTWVSPAVTNGVVFSGHITATGKPYKFNDFGAPTETPLLPSGVVMAMDKETGKKLWEFNVGAPIGIGGPSIGHGMLFVTTGSPAEIGSNKGGYIVAFGLPGNDSGTQVSAQSAKLVNNTSPANAAAISGNNHTSTNTNSTSQTTPSQSQAALSNNATKGQQASANIENPTKKMASNIKTKS